MELGRTAPAIELTDTSGERFQSLQKVKEGPLVVAFYPLAFTGG